MIAIQGFSIFIELKPMKNPFPFHSKLSESVIILLLFTLFIQSCTPKMATIVSTETLKMMIPQVC